MKIGLKPDGLGRRTRQKDIHRYYGPEEVFKIIHRDEWEYKTRQEFYHIRDRALACLLYLTSGRINEVLRLTKDQFREDDDPEILVCHDFWVSKRWDGGMKKKKRPILDGEGVIVGYSLVDEYVPPSDHPHPDIPLPRVGRLAPFTKIVEDYLSLVEGDDTQLFTFSSGRAWCIIERITNNPATKEKGVWNHWFRAQSLSYQVNILRGTMIVSKMRGIKNPQTLEHYYTSEWKEHKEDLKK